MNHQHSVSPGGLVAAFRLEDNTSLDSLNSTELAAQTEPCWLHLNRLESSTEAWLRDHSHIDQSTIDELLAPTTRPRFTDSASGSLLILRGVNLNPDTTPDDMISLRLWIETTRIISLRGPKLMSINAIIDQFVSGTGPRTIGQLVMAMIDGLHDRIDPIIQHISEHLERLEDDVVNPNVNVDRAALIDLRRQIITLHRFLVPQYEALNAFRLAKGQSLLDDDRQHQLVHQLDRVKRFAEDLTAAKAQAMMVQDELSNQLAENANQRIYAVTIIAAIFLPLTLVSGLLGMNVGGIPFANTTAGFGIVTGALALIGIVVYVMLRRVRWL